jgi:hypothetical protein
VSAAPGTERADAVGLVDHQPQPVPRGHLDHLQQRGDVAVDREHAVGRDQCAAPVGLPDAPREVLDVAMVVGEQLGSRQATPVEDRRVAELVAEHDVAWPGQRRDHTRVGQEARSEQQGGLAVREFGEALLEPAVDRHRSASKPRRSGADAPAHRRLRGRLAHPRMVGQPQVVLRAQHEDRLSVEHDVRPLGTADQTRAVMESERLELVEPRLDFDHAGVAA